MFIRDEKFLNPLKVQVLAVRDNSERAVKPSSHRRLLSTHAAFRLLAATSYTGYGFRIIPHHREKVSVVFRNASSALLFPLAPLGLIGFGKRTNRSWYHRAIKTNRRGRLGSAKRHLKCLNTAMPFRLRLTLIFFALLLLFAVTVPLIVPVPELKTVPARQLAGADARYAVVDGVGLHYVQTGSPSPNIEHPNLVLLHSFGSSTFSWRKVAGSLGETAQVTAFDLPGFGFSERPAVTEASNPYTPQAQLELTLGLMDVLGIEQAVLVGHSSGAALAVEVALAHPERVAGLVLVGPVLQSGGPSALVRAVFNTPQATRVGPYIVRQFAEEPGLELLRRTYADPDRLTDADIVGYRRPFQATNWDRALWEVTKANRPVDLLPRLGEVQIPTLVVVGAEDGVVPPEQHRQVADAIEGAQLEVLEGCGHAPQEECPQRFLEAVRPWLEGL